MIGLTNPNNRKGVLSFSSHMGAYLIGLIIQMAKSESYPLFFIHKCLLNRAYKSDGRKRVLPSFFTHRCVLNQAYKFDGRKRVLPFPSHIGAYLIGITIQVAKSGSYPLHLVLRSIASSFHFHLFTRLNLPSAASLVML